MPIGILAEKRIATARGIISKKGGKGSGHFGHSGRPGKIGGSVPGKGGISKLTPGSGRGIVRESGVRVDPWTWRDFGADVEIDPRGERHLNRGLPQNTFGWSLATDYTRSVVKEEIVIGISKEANIDYYDVNDVVAGWATSSNKIPNAALLQQAVSDEFGVKVSDFQEIILSDFEEEQVTWIFDYQDLYNEGLSEYKYRDNAKELAKQYADANIGSDPPWPIDNPLNIPKREVSGISFSAKQMKDYRKIARAMYDRTQAAFKEQGLKATDTITLFRGLGHQDAGLIGAVAKYKGNAIESWSISYSEAEAFVYMTAGDVIAMDIPVSSIFSTARTGLGALTEGEFVIFGSIGHEVAIVQSPS